ncbi:MAG: hypothetical protein Q4F18_10945 [Clostridia bacterium]|nr:hypothetical protein [Clostridia bacterium]
MNTEEFYQAFTSSIAEDAENIMPNDSNTELQYSQCCGANSMSRRARFVSRLKIR